MFKKLQSDLPRPKNLAELSVIAKDKTARVILLRVDRNPRTNEINAETEVEVNAFQASKGLSRDWADQSYIWKKFTYVGKQSAVEPKPATMADLLAQIKNDPELLAQMKEVLMSGEAPAGAVEEPPQSEKPKRGRPKASEAAESPAEEQASTNPLSQTLKENE